MKYQHRTIIPVGIGILAALLLGGVYLGIVSWAESPDHAFDLFWEDRLFVIPILLGFGVQAGLYSVLKLRLYVPDFTGELAHGAAPGTSVGAGGTTSTLAMVACCAHHAADVLPVLGLTAAATFLAEYQTAFLIAGIGTNLIGIGVMLVILARARQSALQMLTTMPYAEET